MHKIVTILSALTISSCFVYADEQPNQLFHCMDAKTFEVNSQCIDDKISTNVQFRDMQSKIVEQSVYAGDYVMASMTFYPKQMTIEIVAHTDALDQGNAIAMLRP